MTAVLDDGEFAALARYLGDEAGLVFDASRRPGLAAVVGERLVATGIPDVARYLALISGRDETAVAERQSLLDTVTIQETHFYRNGAQIDALRSVLLPDLLRRAAAEGRDLRVWSAGCSTGEEPYTLAMLAREVADRHRLDVRARILGTDVSQSALDVAETATYAGRTVDLAEPGAVERWFEGPIPSANGAPSGYRVRDAVRESVQFARHNLVADAPPMAGGEVDLVVCRNVTIYFARETTRTLVERFHDVLRPGGYLMLGHAETLWQVTDAFALVPVGEAFVYRKDAPVLSAPGSLGGAPSVAGARRAADPLLASVRKKIERVRAAHREGVGPAPAAAGPAAASSPRSLSSAAPAAAASAPSRAAEPSPVESGAELLAAAAAAAGSGRYGEAADLAGRALRADALLTDAYVVRGQALSTLGDDAGALDALRKAVYLEPAAGHAHFLLAGALARLGRPAVAARSFRAAAATLHLVSPEIVHGLLDGRDVAELVALCEQLADASERAAAAGSAPGRSTA